MAQEFIQIAGCEDHLSVQQLLMGNAGYLGPNAKDRFIVLRVEAPQLQKLIASAGGTAYYIGEALPGAASEDAAWRIKKVDSPSALAAAIGAVETIYADNSAAFTKIWDNRAGYTYTVA